MIERVLQPGREDYSIAAKFGELLAQKLARDPHFYFFSPDETTSNRLGATFTASQRAWNLPVRTWDLPESASGRIVEMLSENTLFATMMGHLKNGEPGVMASYESFYNIITSQLIQEIKFIEQAEQVTWRPQYPAINLLSTSVCWRQDHNGFSHQSPALLSALLDLPGRKVNCLFPVDDVAAEAAWDFMQSTHNVANLVTFDKNPEPRWIDAHHARFQFENGGASVFGFATDEFALGGEASATDSIDASIQAASPHVVLAAAGDIASREALLAVRILKRDLPWLKIRFVGIAALSYGQIGTVENPLTQARFDEYFGTDYSGTPIIANFHGYAQTLHTILANYASKKRLFVHGFADQGSTTTPFEMLRLNQASRYDLCLDVARLCDRQDLVEKYQRILVTNQRYAAEHGLDLAPITDFRF